MCHVLIIIVNYRTAALTIDCLDSIESAVRAADAPRVRVTVVDNGSADGSVERIAAAIESRGWQGLATLLPLAENRGFAAGNNAAILRELEAATPASFFLLQNPDTLVRPDAIEALSRFMQDNPRAAVAGSQLENEAGRPEYSAHALPRPWHEFDTESGRRILQRLLRRPAISVPPGEGPRACGWVSGASLMIRREALERVGLLDDDYVLYFEEVDLCRRLWAAGWEIWYVPGSRVVHLGGRSTGIYEPERRRTRHWFDSRRRYLLRAHGLGGLLAADLFWAAGRLLRLAERVIPGGRPLEPGPTHFARDLLGGDLRALLGRPSLPDPPRGPTA